LHALFALHLHTSARCFQSDRCINKEAGRLFFKLTLPQAVAGAHAAAPALHFTQQEELFIYFLSIYRGRGLKINNVMREEKRRATPAGRLIISPLMENHNCRMCETLSLLDNRRQTRMH